MKCLVTILSMQRVHNHGSFLQSFALKQLLSEKNAQVRFLDIQPGIPNQTFCNTASHEYLFIKNLKTIMGRLGVKLVNQKQNRIFHLQAQKELGLLPSTMSNDQCDLAIIGSDEVFNCCAESPWGLSMQLFGEIPGASLITSYAASCGQTSCSQIPQTYRQDLKKALLNLETISVRDQYTASFIQDLQVPTPVELHLDPVLIFDFSSYIRPCSFPKKFLLLYSYNNRMNDAKEIAAIRSYVKAHRLEIVCAGCFQYWCKHNIPVDSFELLGYFQSADCVVTDTFHGTILSILFRKRFASVLRDSNRNKLHDLLERLHQEERQLQHWSQLDALLQTPPDYSSTVQLLSQEKKKTNDYLQHLLNICRNNGLGE